MKTKLLAACAAWIALLVSVATAQHGSAADEPTKELNALVAQIQEKLRAGKKSSADLAPELAAFDALRAKYDKEPAAAAKITQLQYSLCRDVLKDAAKMRELRTILATRYRSQIEGSQLARELEMESRMEAKRAEQAALVSKPAPELNFVWSTQPDVKKLSDLKGKVVVLDFWATWCGPCIATFPQIRELVEHYKGADVAVIGITSLQGFVSGLEPARIETKGDPQKEFGLMPEFIKAKNMTWTVAFSEQRVFNDEYAVVGIPHMTIIAPDGTVRHNGLHPAMPHAEKVAKIDALLKEFGKSPKARATSE